MVGLMQYNVFPLRYFPVDFLVRKLEVFSSKVGAEHSWVFKALLDIGFSLPKILDVYNRYSCAEFSLISSSMIFTFCNRLYVSNDPVWLTQGTPYHLLYVLARILEAFADAPNSVSYGER